MFNTIKLMVSAISCCVISPSPLGGEGWDGG